MHVPAPGSRLPDWQLPAGVGRSLWDYAQAPHIADEYDDFFAGNKLFEFDEQVLLQYFTCPGRLADLGCGTGRLLLPFARRGFSCMAVDLSAHMLRVVGEKARLAQLRIDRVQANMVELGCLRSASMDYVIIMFSSLGMVRGAVHRAEVLRHVRRILKPGGKFACHVHNRWYNLRDPQGRRWLLRNAWQALRGGALQWGDKVYDYRGIPRMCLHVYSRREFRSALQQAGFRIAYFTHLDTDRQQPLRWSWCFGGLRANGWLAICE